jgi:putative hydrolase
MRGMSDFPPGFGSGGPGGDDPSRGMPPILGDMFKMMQQQQQGTGSWEIGRQFAVHTATEGEPEANVDPLERITYEQLSRVAELQVQRVTGLPASQSGGAIEFLPVNRTTWVQRTLDDYTPLFDRLASTVDQSPTEEPPPDDPFAWLAPFMKMVEPMMLRVVVGSMIGHLAQRAFGSYDLPIPRPSDEPVLVVLANLDAFGADWSLPPDDLRLWICLHEVTHHAVLGLPHVRARLLELLEAHLSAFESDSSMLEGQLDSIDPGDPASMQRMFDPDVLLGAISSPAQRELQPQLDALVTAVVGYVDHVMDEIGNGLIPSYTMVTEAVRRRRVETSSSDRFVERIFGLELTQKTYDRGAAFVSGVVERAGVPGLTSLWRSARELPTPAEIEAPGLWLARIDLPG